MIKVVLVKPENSGNIGAVARVMANFDIKDLILVNPKANHKSEEAKKRAVHAQKVLSKAKVVKDLSKVKVDYLIATTSKLGSDYNIKRVPLTPEKLAKKFNKKQKIGLVFGSESIGLTNEDVEKCDLTVTIPSSKKYKALNLSHSVAVMLYEFSKGLNVKKIAMATKREKDVINKEFSKVLDKVEFSTPDKKKTQRTVWKRLFSKAMLTKREAFAVIGLLKKLRKK